MHYAISVARQVPENELFGENSIVGALRRESDEMIEGRPWVKWLANSDLFPPVHLTPNQAHTFQERPGEAGPFRRMHASIPTHTIRLVTLAPSLGCSSDTYSGWARSRTRLPFV